MAPVQFEVRVWRNYYDQVHILSQYLNDSIQKEDGRPAKCTISDEERIKIEKEIEQLLKLSDKYLDKCRIFPNDKMWSYDRSNHTTWASSEKFVFHHLMPKKKHMIVSI